MSRGTVQSTWHTGALSRVAERADYEALLALIPDATLFNDWDWLAASADHLDSSRRALTLLVHGRERWLACLPFTWGWERLGGIPVRTLRLLGDPLADRVSLTVAPDHEGPSDVLLEGLSVCPLPWDVLLLSELSEPVRARAMLDLWCRKNALKTRWRHSSHCPYVILDPDRTVTPRRSGVRRELSRRRRKLEAVGSLTLRHSVPQPAEIDSLLNDLKEVEDRSWKGREGVGIFSTPIRHEFFRALSKKLAARGMVMISEAIIGEQRVGYCFGFRFEGSYLYYSPAYLPEFASLGVGRVLLDDLLEAARRQGLTRFDASRTKLRDRHPVEDWVVAHHDHSQLQVFAPTAAARLAYFVEQHVKPPVKWVWLKWKQRRQRQRPDQRG